MRRLEANAARPPSLGIETLAETAFSRRRRPAVLSWSFVRQHSGSVLLISRREQSTFDDGKRQVNHITVKVVHERRAT